MLRRVLIVDDDKEIREIVTFALTCNGFEAIALSNGQQLHHQLDEMVAQAALPDLIILDVMMPGEDGYRICNMLRSSPRTGHIPIMIMTAHSEDIYKLISVDLGAAMHMTKPFHPLKLVEQVKQLLQVEGVEERK